MRVTAGGSHSAAGGWKGPQVVWTASGGLAGWGVGPLLPRQAGCALRAAAAPPTAAPQPLPSQHTRG